MDRRAFVKLTPAFPAAAVTAALVLREDGKPPVELDLAVLKVQAGDYLVLSVPGPIYRETADRLTAYVEGTWSGVKAIVLSDGMKIDGVLRGLA